MDQERVVHNPILGKLLHEAYGAWVGCLADALPREVLGQCRGKLSPIGTDVLALVVAQ